MSFGFPSYYSKKYPIKNNSDLKPIIIECLELLSWKIKSITPNEIIAKSDINFWTWGETIEIQIGNSFIELTSRCSFPMQCFDWGKNKINVLKLIEKFKEIENKQTENSLDDFIRMLKKNYLLLENNMISEEEFIVKKDRLISNLPYDLINRSPFDFLNSLSSLKNQGALTSFDLDIIKSNVL
jgi:hypothetical protein